MRAPRDLDLQDWGGPRTKGQAGRYIPDLVVLHTMGPEALPFPVLVVRITRVLAGRATQACGQDCTENSM